jgi:integrase
LADKGLSIPDTARLAEEFRREMIRQRYTEATVKIYNKGVQLLLSFARPIGIVNRDAIRRWQDDLRSRSSARTTALYGVSVRKMLLWAADNGECDEALARAIPPGRYERQGLPRPLKAEHLQKIDAYFRSRPEQSLKLRELRDRALFYYTVATAARAGEVLQVRRATFKHETVRQTQRRLGEKVFVPPAGVVDLIRRYLEARTDDLDCLWIAMTPAGKVRPLDPAGVLKIWERLANKVGVPKFTNKTLRHTAGMLLAERGHDLVDIMVHLGARDVRAVQGYRELVSRSRIEQVRADLDIATTLQR